MFGGKLPRKLTADELLLLFRILPERKSGYKVFRDLLSGYFLISADKNTGIYILCKNNTTEFSLFHMLVFAAGTFSEKENIYDIIIHEEADQIIEVEIDIKDKIAGFRDAVFSEWDPGNKAPGDDSVVREVVIKENNYILAIAPLQKRIWLHDLEIGVNHFIPAGAFYNDLCFIRNIRDPEIVFKTRMLFSSLDNYKDNELILAFHLYNKSSGKFRIDIPEEPEAVKKKGFLNNLIKKVRN